MAGTATAEVLALGIGIGIGDGEGDGDGDGMGGRVGDGVGDVTAVTTGESVFVGPDEGEPAVGGPAVRGAGLSEPVTTPRDESSVHEAVSRHVATTAARARRNDSSFNGKRPPCEARMVAPIVAAALG